jgi:hypothetical protein
MIIKEPCRNIDKANVLEPNIAFTLKTHKNVKMILKDYWEACKPITKADVLEPNNTFTLKICENVKMMFKNSQGAF